MPLSEGTIRSARIPHGKNQLKISDGGGLYLLIKPSGRYWKLAYRFGGKQKSLALGVYPDVGLDAARERREAAKRLLASNIDPGYVRQQERYAQRMMSVVAATAVVAPPPPEEPIAASVGDEAVAAVENTPINAVPASLESSEQQRLEDRRLRILQQLIRANGYMTNEYLLQQGLDTTGHKISFDRLRTDLAWLSEQQVIRLETSDVWVATLTRHGLEVVEGRLWVPAIRRPEPAA
ncbi:DUF4102 domain-containing protein [Mariprofundus erugo]|uniref:DUF4102 domain-containing protein n=1 Tax=Mariprofundus erugo TaxID=2528639 RepID=A0A5R9GSB9_9PROT|nr:Arm DNA-binding domain-containing protein [Mariprofundus erugo]TLS67839.1 DUF4102 domain-containing protein [Mariprofundus erugo]